ncbi:MAG: radical SAM protein [Myxococcota bacterium]
MSTSPVETSALETAAASAVEGARLDLKVGYRCNNRCVFCVQGDKRDHIADRTTDELREILEANRGLSDGVVLTGGEVTIRPDLIELVGYAKELGYRTIQVQTNGRRLSYLPFVKALVRAGVTEIAPALHGSTPSVHDALVRARGAFAQVVAGIRNCRSLGLPVITNTVVVHDNFRDLPAIVELLARLDVQQLQLAYVHPAGTAEQYFNLVVARFSDAVPFVHDALRAAERVGLPAVTEAIPYCFMQGFERHVIEDRIPQTRIVEAGMTIDDYTAYRWEEGKAKGPPCARCTWVDRCEGPWHEYPREYGWSEFEPRTDAP